MIRVAIVEDDSRYREEMTAYLHRFSQESGHKFHITPFSDGKEITANYSASWDLILMDIEMDGMDGMSAAEAIRQQDQEVVIIFITNMPQYAMKGYTVDALDYVLKPVSYYAFSQRIDRALQRMKRRSKRYIAITHSGGMTKLDVSSITFVEVQDHDMVYHTVHESYMAKGTLSEAEKLLDDRKFFRCNKGYLVNLEYVQSIRNFDVLVGDTWLQVSRPKKKALLDALNDYINEVSK